ncbi:bacterial Ig-like domain-containing protein [Gracilibacillus xinjiangensis]|uniref:Bacterial Ig-like domain-containing protein n=1 Tax=Gracilibacillus xinjiangensis TaxID=1193282 RepID=A0ABV8WRF7_9BACI
MRKHKRNFAIFAIAILLISNFQLLSLAAESSENLPDFSRNFTIGEREMEFNVFGSNTSIETNPDILVQSDNAVTIEANGGKVSSSVDGISFLHDSISADANFEITATAKVEYIGANNQVSFGLMLRDSIGEHQNSEGHESNYVAAGALDQKIKGFYKEGSLTKLDSFPTNKIPMKDEKYHLSIRKSGDTYIVTSNGDSEYFTVKELFSDEIHVGVYAARDARVTFSEISITESRNVSAIKVNSNKLQKREYLVGEELDLKGLEVLAVYEDGGTETLTSDDYFVTDFNSNEIGTNTLTVHYNGLSKTIDVEILPLTVTKLEVKYYPAKVRYYVNDIFKPEGLLVEATYNDGYSIKEVSDDFYNITINGKKVEKGAILNKQGTQEIVITSKEKPKVKTTFDVEVSDAEIKELEIRQKPKKQTYFLEDELDLSGMTIYAVYTDGEAVRLMPNDFDVRGFDSKKIGEKELTVQYKKAEASLPIKVKERELQSIEIDNYPQTTFLVGESFENEGISITKVYDNGDRSLLDEEEFTIDSSGFDSEAPGVYEIIVKPENNKLLPISYEVTVREHQEHEWKSINFGQSTSPEKNTIEVSDDGAIKLAAKEAGKITGDHDGISYYYTELDANEDNFVLSADIKVLDYAKNPHDGQESFGIMARDAIGTEGDSAVFASNIAAIGGFSGSTKEPNGTQLFVRTGVEAPDGTGSQGLQHTMIEEQKPTAETTETNYHLTLTKTNSGFIGQLNDGEEHIIFEPEILNVQNDKMYVGFYTARVATIEVRDIELEVSSTKTDAPKLEQPKAPLASSLDIESLEKTGDESYSFKFKSNVNGVASVRKGLEVVAEEVDVIGGKLVELETTLATNQDTNFSVVFLPDDTQNLEDYSPIIRNFTVSMKVFNGGKIYVAPDGSANGDGSREQPLDLDTAIDYVHKGQQIIVQEGHYIRNQPLLIAKYNDGTEDEMKVLMADPDAGNRPVIDFDKRTQGVIHSGDYWHVKGIDFKRSAPNMKGYNIGGSHNIIENVAIYENGDTGLQISRTDQSNTIEDWPAYNLVLNSISFDNRDPSENNADGFAAKLTVGEGNVFRGSVSHNNIDDGWDLYTKVGTGAIGAVTIENSIAYNNGYITGSSQGKGSQNGFKLGGEGVHVPHVIRNSVAFGNGASGFSSNSNPGVIAENNYAFDNAGGNITFITYSGIEEDFLIDGFVSFHTKEGNAADEYPSRLLSEKNFMYDGKKTANLADNNVPEDVLSVLKEIIEIERDANGQINWGDTWDILNQFMAHY